MKPNVECFNKRVECHDGNSKGCRAVNVAMFRIRYLPQISGSLDCVRYSGVIILTSKCICIPCHYSKAPVGGPLKRYGSHDKWNTILARIQQYSVNKLSSCAVYPKYSHDLIMWPIRETIQKRIIGEYGSSYLTTMLYAIFWVIPRRLNFICRRFGTLCLYHLHRQVGTYLPMKMEQSIQHLEHSESLESRISYH